ncbi:MAG TPA: globin domain-containing protein [Polyangiaceae bacterium]|jgi:hemoglobin-like flavoprotein|nr:globin domain-containing protein [Polyangiaceae bacterium]
MNVTPSRRRQLLEESFELALLRDPDFPRLFYEILFREYPATRPMFKRNSLNAQRTMLSKTLMAAVDHIDDEAWLLEHLAPLGAEHVGYGVSPEMYEWMGEALRASIAEVCAEAWTEEHDQAWREAYQIIVKAMRSGERP